MNEQVEPKKDESKLVVSILAGKVSDYFKPKEVMAKKPRQINLWVTADDYHVWEDIGALLEKYAININCDSNGVSKGVSIKMLEYFYELIKVMFPDADKCCCVPVAYTDVIFFGLLAKYKDGMLDDIKKAAVDYNKEIQKLNKSFGDTVNNIMTTRLSERS